MIDLKLGEFLAAAARPFARFNNFYVLIAIYLLTRSLMYAHFLGHLPNDVRLYEHWGRLIENSGQFPVADSQWEYPPLAGVLMVLANVVIPRNDSFYFITLIADALILLLLVTQTRGRRPNSAAWLYVLLGSLVGEVLLVRFDVVTALFAVAGLVWVSKPVRSGLALGIGASLKLWPLLLVVAHPRKQLPKAAGAMLATVAVINVALWLWSSNAFDFLTSQQARGLQIESPAALPFVIAKTFGAHIEFWQRYGAMEVVASGTQIVGLIVMVIGLLAIGLVILWRLLGKLEQVGPADVGLVLVLVAIATSRVGSPQYLIWVAAIGPVCLLDSRTRMKPVLVLVALCVGFTWLVYPLNYASLEAGGHVGALLQTARIFSLVAATGWGYLRIFRDPTPVASRAPGATPRRSWHRL